MSRTDRSRTRARRYVLLPVGALVAGVLTVLGAPAATTGPAAVAAAGVPAGAAAGVSAGLWGGARPNIVLVTTDDQRLDELAWMPRTRRLVGAAGATFENALSPHPLCCPARAELLTAQYAHNNGVRHNTGPWGGFRAFTRDHRRQHMGSWLRRAGYQTAFVGKFLNGYGARDGDQPGWDEWSPTLAGTYRFTDFKLRVDGRNRSYDLDRNPRHYVADVVGNRGIAIARQFARSRKPFFLWVSHVAPHSAQLPDGRWGPPIPAPRHRTLFADSRPQALLEDPSFREADRSDKPGAVRSSGTTSTTRVVRLHRARIRSLQSVDEANARLVRALRDAGELDNTVFVFTSDNGYLLGEHHLTSKNWPYEASLRVPLLVRGPGVPAGVARRQNVTLVDLASTFLHLARSPRGSSDGADLRPALTDDAGTSATSLIQAGAATKAGWRWRGVRSSRYVYVRWHSGAHELYDLQEDPDQLENLLHPSSGEPVAAEYRPVLAELRRRYEALRRCAGAACHADFGPEPQPAVEPDVDPAQPTG
jgi:arylsulfatase A-like enzyme